MQLNSIYLYIKNLRKGDWIVMKDVVLDEIIDEEIYQNLKKEIGKKDDYLNIEEYEKLLEKIDVILT